MEEIKPHLYYCRKMNLLSLIIPPSYFLKTRLNNIQALIFHTWFEYLPNLAILFWVTEDITLSLVSFGLGYLAFISLYEIGYAFNDLVSSKKEKEPRLRAKNITHSPSSLTVFILFRLTVFGLITNHLSNGSNPTWWIFYAVLATSFTLHNVIKNPAYKLLTFISLAFCRFLAPIFNFLDTDLIGIILPAILLYYVIYRTLTYLESKNLLQMKDRKQPKFKMGYFLLLLPLSYLMTTLQYNYMYVVVNLYFVSFTMLFWIKESISSKT